MKKQVNYLNIAITFFVMLLLIQAIRPVFNSGNAYTEHDVFHVTQVPQDVKIILENACYDCHSDHTNYPWYIQIQPVGLWMQSHVDKGKRDLNFSLFATYSPRVQKDKMEEVIKSVREGGMPVPVYVLVHKGARLGEGEKQKLIKWAESMYNGIAVQD